MRPHCGGGAAPGGEQALESQADSPGLGPSRCWPRLPDKALKFSLRSFKSGSFHSSLFFSSPLPPTFFRFKQSRPWVSCFWNVTENSLLRKAGFP